MYRCCFNTVSILSTVGPVCHPLFFSLSSSSSKSSPGLPCALSSSSGRNSLGLSRRLVPPQPTSSLTSCPVLASPRVQHSPPNATSSPRPPPRRVGRCPSRHTGRRCPRHPPCLDEHARARLGGGGAQPSAGW